MPSKEIRHRLASAIEAGKRWFAATRENENIDLIDEAASGRDAGRVQFLPRIRALGTDIVVPLVRDRRHLIEEIGALWVGEEAWRRGHLPRIYVEYHSRVIAPDPPQATLIFGFHPDGTAVITWQLKSPLRHHATHLRRIDDLSPEIIAEEVDAFLAVAIAGHLGDE
jgi:hypothetical protein